MENIFLGIDIGGTAIKSACFKKNGEIIHEFSCDSNAHKGSNYVEKAILKCAKSSGLKFKAIGICAPGQVLDNGQIGGMTPNIKDWQGFNLINILKNKFNCPVECSNDANAALLGEMNFGDGKHHKNAVMITLGTGVGGGIMVNGNLVNGYNYYAAEIGHTKIILNGNQCNCGQKGCIEAYVGRDAITKMGKDIIKNKLINSPKDIFNLAEENNKNALEIFEKIGFYLAICLGNVVNMLNPEIIIIGGGVSRSSKYIIPSIKKNIKQFAFSESLNDLKIIPSKLENNAGVLGCLSLALKALEK